MGKASRMAKMLLSQKQIDALVLEANDRCMICKTPLLDLAHTYYGRKGKKPLLTGTCCASKLDAIMSIGILVMNPKTLTPQEYAKAFNSHPFQALIPRKGV